jgi:adenylate cyclase
MYQSTKSRFLNFYGPPGTIVTVSYHQLLELQEEVAFKQKRFDFGGKAVFIGLSERFLSEQKDGFYTVFSELSGLDLSGVEIAATAFANLIEGKPLQPISSWTHLIVLLLWGVVIGIICYYLPTLIAAGTTIGLSMVYFAFSEYQFKTIGTWYPLVLPLLIQSPLAFFSAVLWKTIDANRERESIRKVLRYYFPDRAVDQLDQLAKSIGKSIGDFKPRQERVYAICLYTDAKQYTSLSESMDPEELGHFMNKYYEVLSKPVKEQGGMVLEFEGDSMLALWVTEPPNLASRCQACQAALNIAKAVDEFNRSSGSLKLPTRIGLHSGDISLGDTGAIDHYHYNAVGDIINTLSRIENHNKRTGTQVLVSEDVIGQLDTFLTRNLGRFRLAGKTKPIGIHELVCRKEESDERQRELCATFPGIFGPFRGCSWTEVEKRLQEMIERFGEDGPCLYYLDKCKEYQKNPPDKSWDGVIIEAEK